MVTVSITAMTEIGITTTRAGATWSEAEEKEVVAPIWAEVEETETVAASATERYPATWAQTITRGPIIEVEAGRTMSLQGATATSIAMTTGAAGSSATATNGGRRMPIPETSIGSGSRGRAVKIARTISIRAAVILIQDLAASIPDSAAAGRVAAQAAVVTPEQFHFDLDPGARCETHIATRTASMLVAVPGCLRYFSMPEAIENKFKMTQ